MVINIRYDDQLMPCPEAGLGFQFGDVLAILNQARSKLGVEL